MAKELPAQIITQLDAQQKRPVLLLTLGLTVTIRFCTYKTDIVFPTLGNTFTAKTIGVSGLTQSLEGQIQRVVLKFDNAAGDMAAYANAEDFRGKTLLIQRVYLDELGDSSYYVEVFNGVFERPTGTSHRWLTIPATAGKPLSRRTLITPYQRMCPWSFGDDNTCDFDGNADTSVLTASGTADSGSTSTLVDSSLTEANDYWNFGRIEMVKAGITYSRRVADFDAGADRVTFGVQLPVAVDGSTTYTITKGCDQSWDTCGAANAWGPSAGNQDNFGGCLHIANPKDAE